MSLFALLSMKLIRLVDYQFKIRFQLSILDESKTFQKMSILFLKGVFFEQEYYQLGF